MTAALRSSFSRFLAIKNNAGKFGLPAVSTQLQRAIKSKAIRDIEGIKRPPPFDYKNKNYNIFRAIFDVTTSRLDDNSKVIVVEGPVASGKTAFAEQLAKDLDMLFVPAANMDDIFINGYGFDLRTLNDKLPKSVRTYDTNDFLKDPHHLNVAAYQYHMFILKYEYYFDALSHLLNTGQGVVLERSCYSDFVFVEAMLRAGYISKNFYRAYNEVKASAMPFLMKPHLVIYLDVPLDGVQANIKKRNDPNEINSSVLNANYLKDIEHFYKHEFLKEMSQSSEILVYDWTNGGEVELVVEDIERIDFDRFEKHDSQLHDWRLPQEMDWRDARAFYTNELSREKNMCFFELPIFYCSEMVVDPEDAKKHYDVWTEAPGMKYAYGYNEAEGDKNIMWKNTTAKSTHTPRN